MSVALQELRNTVSTSTRDDALGDAHSHERAGLVLVRIAFGAGCDRSLIRDRYQRPQRGAGLTEQARAHASWTRLQPQTRSKPRGSIFFVHSFRNSQTDDQ